MAKSPDTHVLGKPRSLFRQLKLKYWKMDPIENSKSHAPQDNPIATTNQQFATPSRDGKFDDAKKEPKWINGKCHTSGEVPVKHNQTHNIAGNTGDIPSLPILNNPIKFPNHHEKKSNGKLRKISPSVYMDQECCGSSTAEVNMTQDGYYFLSEKIAPPDLSSSSNGLVNGHVCRNRAVHRTDQDDLLRSDQRPEKKASGCTSTFTTTVQPFESFPEQLLINGTNAFTSENTSRNHFQSRPSNVKYNSARQKHKEIQGSSLNGFKHGYSGQDRPDFAPRTDSRRNASHMSSVPLNNMYFVPVLVDHKTSNNVVVSNINACTQENSGESKAIEPCLKKTEMTGNLSNKEYFCRKRKMTFPETQSQDSVKHPLEMTNRPNALVDGSLYEQSHNPRVQKNENANQPLDHYKCLRHEEQIQALNCHSSDSCLDGLVSSSEMNSSLVSLSTVTAKGQFELDRKAITDGLLSCEICEDRATGLHYGAVTCEGCKGFFKRTVQNKKIYKCSKNGDCVISKYCRNRCQYCRFRKCLLKGMVMAAVRLNRMPGGRTSGAIYDMYKVKYKKHKSRKSKSVSSQMLGSTTSGISTSTSTCNSDMGIYLPAHLEIYAGDHTKVTQKWLDDQQKYTPGTRIKSPTATPEKLRIKRCTYDIHSLFKASQGKDRPESIQKIINCEYYQDIIKFAHRVEHEMNASRVLGTLGDDIVYHLVRWAQGLPFQGAIPLSVYLQILTNKWHEILFLTTTSYQTILGKRHKENDSLNTQDALKVDVEKYMEIIYVYMNERLHKNISLKQLREEIQVTMDKITLIIHRFRQLNVTVEEYVCLKIILLLSTDRETMSEEIVRIQEEYIVILQEYIASRSPQSPNRLGELILLLPQIQSTAALLLKSRMIFIPFLLSNLSHHY